MRTDFNGITRDGGGITLHVMQAVFFLFHYTQAEQLKDTIL